MVWMESSAGGRIGESYIITSWWLLEAGEVTVYNGSHAEIVVAWRVLCISILSPHPTQLMPI